MWPSERIAQGGLFHTPKIKYSKETADLLKLLMKESKMTMLMRKQIDHHLRNGEPLPKPEPRRINIYKDADTEAMEILRKAHNAKRKSLSEIKASGAYETPRNRPKPDDKMPSEKSKKLLQEAMSGLRMSETTLKPKRKPKTKHEPPATTDDIINELLDQINERAEWLAEMEQLGEGKRYRDEIREQIAERLRQIKALETKKQLTNKGISYLE
ncbi:UPF0193 protein EVG1 homolog [Musca vetustissima]|uniref:UPF0193 protein EVG1 homolog n=1 Tax=Musca vetustissima TaxID=27455 RepID=UPI002AB5EAAD|nr:UPF0193 protein EVG1 homolog [Musca vetustissima]